MVLSISYTVPRYANIRCFQSADRPEHRNKRDLLQDSLLVLNVKCEMGVEKFTRVVVRMYRKGYVSPVLCYAEWVFWVGMNVRGRVVGGVRIGKWGYACMNSLIRMLLTYFPTL